MREVTGFARTRPLSWFWTTVLIVAFSSGAVAIVAFAAPYFFSAKAITHFGYARRFGLLLHICAASIALLLGPAQIWMGWTGHYVRVHRKLGMLYLISVVISCVTAIYLVATTQRGLVFGSALGSLTLAWI